MRLGLALCLTIALLAGLAPAQDLLLDPRQLPPAEPLVFDPPEVDRVVLDNGLILFLLEDHELPLLHW